jgi:hypothetical protein
MGRRTLMIASWPPANRRHRRRAFGDAMEGSNWVGVPLLCDPTAPGGPWGLSSYPLRVSSELRYFVRAPFLIGDTKLLELVMDKNAGQKNSPAYRLAALDPDFLLSDSMRGVRLQLELRKGRRTTTRVGRPINYRRLRERARLSKSV